MKRDIILDEILRQMPDVALLEGELMSRNLHRYLRGMWHVVEPARPFIDNWHIGAKCEHLEAVVAGQIKKLLINEPPRMAKSLTCGVGFPTWVWTKFPEKHFFYTSYDGDLSTRDSVKCRRVIDHEWYQQRWGHVYQLTTDQNVKDRFENDRTGVRLATSINGSSTGEGGDFVVIDDPHNMKEIHSETKRKEVIRTYKEALSSRLNDPKTGAFIVIMQRGHESDLSGHLIAEEEGWEHLCLPMEYESKRKVWVTVAGKRAQVEQDVSKIKTSIGFKDPRKKEGELLFPKRFPAEVVARMKTTLGAYGTAGQFQQRPNPAGGSIFSREKFRFYRRSALPRVFDQMIQSWDMSFKKTDDSSKVAGQVWGRSGANKYLIARVNRRMSFPESIAAVQVMTAQYPEALAKLIEDKANGPAIMTTLGSKIPGIMAWPEQGAARMQSKEARAHAYSIHVDAGNVWLPHPEEDPSIEEFLQQHESCPNGTFWDEIDAAGQAMDYFGPVYDIDDLLSSAAAITAQAATSSPWTAGRDFRDGVESEDDDLTILAEAASSPWGDNDV